MLILTRQTGEAISIGSDVEITILEISGDHVRIGIKAPIEIPVLRSELRREVLLQNRLALQRLNRSRIGLHVRTDSITTT